MIKSTALFCQDLIESRASGWLGKRSTFRDGKYTRSSPKNLVSLPDLLAKAYLAKMLTAFGKTFVTRSGTRFGFSLVPRGVFGPIYTPTLSQIVLTSTAP